MRREPLKSNGRHAAGSITLSALKATDNAGNGETPASRSFRNKGESSIAMRGAMKVSAIPWASGTRPMPQKKRTAMSVTTTLRATWIHSVLRVGRLGRRGRYKAALKTKLAAARHTLTAKMPIVSTRCFITASIVDSTATAPSAAIKPWTGWVTRRTRQL